MFENRVALITGGTRGIGRAIAYALAENGVQIAIAEVSEVSEEMLAELRGKGVKAEAYRCDVASFQAAEETVKAVIADFGKIDILVNNAGITRDKLMMAMNEEDFDRVIEVNLKGVFNMTKACLRPFMKNRYGRIVNLASVVGMMGNPGQVNYAASKAGVIGLTKTVAKEYASKGITCNAIAPGYIMTAMTDAMPAAARESLLSHVPVGTYGKPEDVAYAACFLADDRASYITGEVIKVDGGMYI